MLAKRIDAGGRRNFGKLGNYCRDADHEGEKCLMSWQAGCYSEEYDMAIIEIEATQAINTRTTSDKTYHLMISFRPEDEAKLTQDAFRKIEETMAEALGLSEHQRVAGVHKNTNNLHMHVAYNLINPEKFTIHTPFQDFPALSKACRALEKEFGLAVDNGIETSNPLQPKITQRAAAMEAHSGEQSFQSFILDQKNQILAAMQQAQNWQDAHQILVAHGIVIKEKGNGLVLTNPNGKEAMKASDFDRSMSKTKLVSRFGEYQQQPETEKHSKQKPPEQYDRKPIQPSSQERNRFYLEFKTLIAERKAAIDAEKMREKKAASGHEERLVTIREQYPFNNWHTFLQHRAEQGDKTALFVLRSREATGKIASPEEVKKTDRDRLYQEYQAINKERREAAQAIKGQGRDFFATMKADKDSLFQEYQSMSEQRRKAMDAEYTMNRATFDQLNERWQTAKGKASGRAMFGMMVGIQKRDTAKAKEDHQKRLAEIEKKYPFKDWNDFLKRRADHGNGKAIAILNVKENSQHSKEKQHEKLAALDEKYPFKDWNSFLRHRADRGDTAAISALKAREKKASSVERQEAPGKTMGRLQKFTPHFSGCSQRIDNRGVVIFTLQDGGTIRDADNKLHFSKETAEAAQLYALAKFGKHFVQNDSTIRKTHGIGTRQNTKPHLGILKDAARNGVRKLSELPMVSRGKKHEMFLPRHAHDDLER